MKLSIFLGLALAIIGAWFLFGQSHPEKAQGIEHADAPLQSDTPGVDAAIAIEADTQEAEPSAPSGEIEVTARQYVPSLDAGHNVKGIVIDDVGDPVPEFMLVAGFRIPKPDGGRGYAWEEYDFGPFVDGAFELEGLKPGKWRIEPSSASYRSVRRSKFSVPNRKGDLELSMTRRAVLTGLIVDPEGNPRPGAEWVPSAGLTRNRVAADESGRFRVEIKPGAFGCFAQDSFYASSSEILGSVAPLEVKDLRLELRLGGRLEGQVLDGLGAAIADSYVSVHGTKRVTEQRKVQADSSGQFAVEHMAPGAYWAQASKTEKIDMAGKRIRESFEIVAGQTTTIVLGGANPDAVVLTGTLYRDGAPAPKSSVWGSLNGEESFSSGTHTLTDEHGQYRLEFPKPGKVTLLVAPIQSFVISIPHVLDDKREQEFDIVVPSGSISGVVERLDGGKHKRPSVQIAPEGRTPIASMYLTRTLRTDKQGRFEFAYLPAGSYRVNISNVMDANGIIEHIQVAEGAAVEGLTLRFGETGTAQVRVLDGAGNPVPGASVFARDDAGHIYNPRMGAVTDVAGEHSYRKLGVGGFRFFATKGELTSPMSETVLVQPDSPVRVDLKLSPAARGTLQILDRGEPVEARFTLVDTKGQDYSRTLAYFDHERYLLEGEDTSQYKVGPLPPGDYMVTATALDGRSVKGTLRLVNDKVTELTLHLAP